MTGAEYIRAMTENHPMGTIEQEHDPLLLEQDYQNTHNGSNKWSGYWSSLKHKIMGKGRPSHLHDKLMNHKEDDDDDESDISLYEDWYGAPKPSWRARCGKTILWSVCICIGVPFGLLLLLFILYAVFFRPPPVHSPIGLPSLDGLNLPARLLTYNIFLRPPGVKNNANDYKNERLDEIIQTILPHYDIITFQEAFAFGNHRVDRLIEAAEQLGFGYIMSPRHGPWELAADGGLLLLSRYPILQADILEYPRGLHSDWLSAKGALHALIGLDNDQTMVHVYTTHTQASYGQGGTRSEQDILMRLEQFGRLGQFIYDTAYTLNTTTTNVPIIAMGDFNIDSVDHAGSITDLPVNDSRAYTMMMDVLNGIKHSDDTARDWSLSFIDMAYHTFGYHPITFGDYLVAENNSLVPAEITLTHPQQLMTVQSIDQLLWSPSPVSSKPNSSLSLSNVTVEKFLVSGQPFTQLSDHYGFSCLLSL